MNKDQEDRLLLKLIIEQLNKVTETVETTDNRINNIDVTLAKNTASLEEHIRRTNLLESQLAPIKTAYDWVVVSAKVIGILSLLTSIVVGMFEIVKFAIKG